MRKMQLLVLVPAALLAAACGRDGNRVDDALKSDLALASQAQPYGPQQFVSPQEAGYGYNPYAPQNPYAPNPYGGYGYPQRIQTAAQPTYYPAPAPAPVRRTSTASRRSGGGTIYRAPAPAEPKRNTKRDAVIGATAGAVIGATTSRDKLKGAIIGAAAGGLLGGIIGHTVDVQRP